VICMISGAGGRPSIDLQSRRVLIGSWRFIGHVMLEAARVLSRSQDVFGSFCGG
jgi:hypothetical protein